SVRDFFNSFVLTDKLTQCTTKSFAIIEFSQGVHLFENAFVSYFWVLKIDSPKAKVFHCCEKAGCTGICITQDTFLIPSAVRVIGICSIGDNLFVIFIEKSVVHLEGLENPVFCKSRKRLT